jgi:membrane protein DedA with SNARE-associated domain
MTIIYTPAITYPTILMAMFGRQLCPPIPAVLFLIASGALANYFPRTTSNQPGLIGVSHA